jgi:hypothetical protein
MAALSTTHDVTGRRLLSSIYSWDIYDTTAQTQPRCHLDKILQFVQYRPGAYEYDTIAQAQASCHMYLVLWHNLSKIYALQSKVKLIIWCEHKSSRSATMNGNAALMRSLQLPAATYCTQFVVPVWGSFRRVSPKNAHHKKTPFVRGHTSLRLSIQSLLSVVRWPKFWANNSKSAAHFYTRIKKKSRTTKCFGRQILERVGHTGSFCVHC